MNLSMNEPQIDDDSTIVNHQPHMVSAPRILHPSLKGSPSLQIQQSDGPTGWAHELQRGLTGGWDVEPMGIGTNQGELNLWVVSWAYGHWLVERGWNGPRWSLVSRNLQMAWKEYISHPEVSWFQPTLLSVCLIALVNLSNWTGEAPI